jgi:threonine dehydrogenase-like Zn-dependent dehydrogenase
MSGLNVLNLSPMSNRHYTDMLPRTAALVNRGVYTPGELVSHMVRYTDVKAVNALLLKSIDKSDGYMKGVITF